MELLDDDSVETMVTLYCPPGRVNTKPIKLFVELANAEIVENVTQLSQQYGVENLRIEVPRVSVDRRSSVRGFDIDLNVGCSYQYGKGFSDPDLDNIVDDINDEGPNDGNDHSPTIENPSCGIVIRYNPEAYMSIVDPDAIHASEFPEYPDIIPTHLMLVDPKPEELFVG
ncbi:hypothetical protein PVK06_033987 [Gossypium arboreum]|uniref:Uncharacterized protein n=1 Tax=Gossypium arboreum TaxID=29729 RepID=A0ABR0NDW6_GOSAR|nr:hypothetical protein PVK06_033987 [Gossypium arboreum]